MALLKVSNNANGIGLLLTNLQDCNTLVDYD
jgi:hypothetical protein